MPLRASGRGVSYSTTAGLPSPLVAAMDRNGRIMSDVEQLFDTSADSSEPLLRTNGHFDASSLFASVPSSEKATGATEVSGNYAIFASPQDRGPQRDFVDVSGLFAGGAAAAASAPAGMAVTKAPFSRRLRLSRRGWAIAISGVLVAALAGGAAVAFVEHRASTTEALQSAADRIAVEQEEARVRGNVLKANLTEYALRIESERAIVVALADPLAKMAGVSEEVPRSNAEKARLSYLTVLEHSGLHDPGDLDDAPIDASSSSGIDAAQRELDAYEAQLTIIQNALDDAVDAQGVEQAAFSEAMSAFTQSTPAFAAQVVAASPDARESLRTALTEAAAAVAATDAAVAGGTAPWTAYTTAVNALRADQLRAVYASDEESDSSSARSGATTTDPAGDSSTATQTPAAPTPTPTPKETVST